MTETIQPLKHDTPGRRLTFGVAACVLVGAYLLLSPAYALLNFEQYATTTAHLLRYVIVPGLVGIAFLAVGLLGRPGFASAVGKYGLSVLVALFLFETFLTYRSVPIRLGMLGQLNDNQRQELHSGEMVRGFTLRQLNARSGTTELRQAMLSGFPGTNVVLCAPEDRLITYTADRHGFNNRDAAYDRPIDYLVLGDSFVEGFCLPLGEDMVARMAAGGTSAVSFGIRGNGPLTELAQLGRFGPIFRPPHVVMVFFEGNDWENLEKELTEPWLRAALADGADFGSQASAEETMRRAETVMETEIVQNRVTVVDLMTRTALLRNFIALQQTFTKLGLIYPKAVDPVPEFPTILARAKAISESWGGRFTLVYVPRPDRYIGTFNAQEAFDQLRHIVLSAAAAEEVDVVDLSELFRTLDDPALMYAPDSHFSPEGATFAASAILERLPLNNRVADR